MVTPKDDFYATLSKYWTPAQVSTIHKYCDAALRNTEQTTESENAFYDNLHAHFYLGGRSFKNFIINLYNRLHLVEYTMLSWEHELNKEAEVTSLWDELYNQINSTIQNVTILPNDETKDRILISIVNAIYLLVYNYRYSRQRETEIQDYKLLEQFFESYESVNKKKSKFAPVLRLSYADPLNRTQVDPIKSRTVIADFFNDFGHYYKLRHLSDFAVLPEAKNQLQTKQSSIVRQCIYRIIKILIKFGILNKPVKGLVRKAFINEEGYTISVNQEASYFAYRCLVAVGISTQQDCDKEDGIEYVKNRLKEIKDDEQQFGFQDICDIKYDIILNNALSKYSRLSHIDEDEDLAHGDDEDSEQDDDVDSVHGDDEDLAPGDDVDSAQGDDEDSEQGKAKETLTEEQKNLIQEAKRNLPLDDEGRLQRQVLKLQ